MAFRHLATVLPLRRVLLVLEVYLFICYAIVHEAQK